MAEHGSIGGLSNEILLQILDILEEVSPKSLLSLLRTSKSVCALTTPVVYRTLHLDLCDPNARGTKELLERVGRDRQICSYIRNIIILDGVTIYRRNTEPSHLACLDKVRHLIPRLFKKCPSVRQIRYYPKADLDQTFWEEIEHKTPPVKLHVERLRDDDISSFHALKGKNCLESLDVYMEGCHRSMSLSVLEEIVYSCSKLQELSLRVPSHYITDSDWLYEPPLNEVRGKLNIRSLQLSNCCPQILRRDFLSLVLRSDSLKSLSLYHCVPSPTEMIEIVGNNLTSLELHYSDLGLRESSLKEEQLWQLVYQCKHIENLKMGGLTRFIDTQLLQQLGKSLVSLCLQGTPLEGPLSSKEKIKGLQGLCPRLKYLSFDIGYHDKMPYEIFRQVGVSLSYLKRLSLMVVTEDLNASITTLPSKIMQSLHYVWRLIWSEMRSSLHNRYHFAVRPPLQNLTFLACFDLRSHGVDFRDHLSFNADLADYDNDAECGVAKVTCTNWERHKSTYRNEKDIAKLKKVLEMT